ncbi:MAG: hypothetical protein ABIR54_21995 [Burkholderiaceae bacterium]|jgi:hypothetical protein
MSMPMPTEGRATLARSYRNLSEREIRAKLEGQMSDAERVTAKAELLRRNAGDNGPDTTLATGFAPTSAFDAETPPAAEAVLEDGMSNVRRRGRAWPWVLVLMAASIAALGWAIHAKLVHIG